MTGMRSWCVLLSPLLIGGCGDGPGPNDCSLAGYEMRGV